MEKYQAGRNTQHLILNTEGRVIYEAFKLPGPKADLHRSGGSK